ncbi:MAG: response regulator [Desulfarculaceae bacterium]|nr:response regulator [Desulfarculaceae bacterium]
MTDQWKLLLVDDEQDIREVTSLVIKDQGFEVYTAEDGVTGFEMVESVAPQIVVTDVKMPKMGGIELLRKVKEHFEDIEVIVITAFGEMNLAIEALQLDASDFINKPIDDAALKLALSRAKERYLSRQHLKEYTRFLEQKNLDQARILHRDKLISLGRLSASVVHEINNPISGILNYAHLMNRMIKKRNGSDIDMEKFSRFLDIMESESSRISEIVSSLLTFSRKSEATFARVDVKTLLEKSALLCRHKLELSSIELAMEIDPEIEPIHADFNQIQQSIINLVFNAVDAIGTGGKITISAMNKKEEGQVWIVVRDNGKGIDPEEINHIFEPFYTTKDEGYGVGLGLSIIFGIMDRHGGSIEADSKPGTGTAFTLRFPFGGQDR